MSAPLPVDIAGSSTFGRYPRISICKTYNMILSDDWLVPYSGYVNVKSITKSGIGTGRAVFNSPRLGKMIVVADNGVYSVSSNSDIDFVTSVEVNFIASIGTFLGDVFIDENEKQEIAICDKSNIYIYNYGTGTFKKANLDFIPGYVCFQDGRFVASATGTPTWRLSSVQDSTVWPAGVFNGASFTGTLQTKGDTVVATVRPPSRGNALYIFGNIVTEIWYDVGNPLFPYQKQTSLNIDYGCLNASTIAFTDNLVVWLGSNEKSGPVIMYTTGGDANRISTDGIDFLFASLTNPSNSYGFIFRQAGHIIYQLTFPDDNTSIIYDFTTQKFFNVTDNKMDYHIAKRVAFFNGNYYFVSFNDANLYQFSPNIYDLDGEVCPRIRNTSHIRKPDMSPFVLRDVTVQMEQGEAQESQVAEVAISLTGGDSWGNYYSQQIFPLGVRQNWFRSWIKVRTNDIVLQYRFYGDGRFVVGNGVATIL
jgi:hypothetical protein